MTRITAAAARAARLPGVRDVGAQSAARSRRPGRRDQLRRAVGEHRPGGRLRQDGRRGPSASSTATRGCATRCGPTRTERIEHVLRRTSDRCRWSSASTARTGRPRAPRPRGAAGVAGRRWRHRPTVRAAATEPTLEVEVDLAAAQAHGIKPGDVRRAAAALLSGLGSATCSRSRRSSTWWCGRARAARQPDQRPGPAHRHRPAAATCAWATSPRSASRRRPTVIKRDGVSRCVDVVADVEGRDVDAVRRRRRGGVKRDPVPARVPRRGAGRPAPSCRPRSGGWPVAIAAAIGIFLLLQAAFGSWRLAVWPSWPCRRRSRAACSRRS